MADPREPVLAQLEALRRCYVAELPAKLAQIRSSLAALASAWDDELLRTAHRHAYSLASSGATFGLAGISDAARSLEQLLEGIIEAGAGPVHRSLQGIEPLLLALEEAGRTPSAQPVIVVPALPPRPAWEERHGPIFVVDDDTSHARELRLQYKMRGYEAREFHDFRGLAEAIVADRPPAIVMDVVFPEGELAGIQQIATLRRRVESFPPVVFVSQREDVEARLASVRAGAAAYFNKPIDIEGMVETLDRITTRDEGPPYRVLIVDDDEGQAEHNALILESAGIVAGVLTDPLQVLELLASFRPELILMDLYMPGCTGTELAAVIRQREAYVGMPIVFFSVETDIGKHLEAMRAGGDDFLIKPMAPAHLLATVETRVRRARSINALMVRDSLTGLLNHTAIEEQLTRELGLHIRQNGVLSYALIDLDHFKRVNDSYGHGAGDRVLRGLSRFLRQRFRKTDLLGRYGGEEFVVIMPGTDANVGARVVEDVRAAFARIRFVAEGEAFSVTFSAGVAGAPPIADAATLQHEADRALYRAKDAGRNRVMVAEGRTQA